MLFIIYIKDKCEIIINPYRIGPGPGYQRPPQVSPQQGTCGNYATAKHCENKSKKRGGKQVKKQREAWKGRCSLIRVGTLNIGTMTGRGRELADMMERRNVDILCLQETRWKGSRLKQETLEVDAKYSTTELMEEKMG